VDEGNDNAEYCSSLSYHGSISFQPLCSKSFQEFKFAENSGLRFIPLYSPARKPGIPSTAVVSFSPEEITRFQVCFEEGYDLPDERYQQWVHMYHPESECV